MDFKLKLRDNAKNIRESFIDHFVMSWNEFQIKQENWITKMAQTNCPIDREWYENAYMWEKMNPAFPSVPMANALAFLREHNGLVFFMTETGKDTTDWESELDNPMKAAESRVCIICGN